MMICDICHSREAVICYTEIINGIKKEQHLCKTCASRFTGIEGNHAALGGAGFLASLLAGVLGAKEETFSDEDMQKTNFFCPTCHMTYNEFLRDGQFGCQDCYRTFGLILDPYLKKIQGNTTHIGKRPKYQTDFMDIPDFDFPNRGSERPKKETMDSDMGTSGELKLSEIDQLQSALQTAIKAEEYEEAARLRDQIRLLKARSNTSPVSEESIEAKRHE